MSRLWWVIYVGILSCGLMTTGCYAIAPQLAITHWQTSAGSEVYFVNTPDLPFVDVRVLFDAGSARDENQAGIAFLTNHLLLEGSQHADANQLAAQFEDVGAQYGVQTDRDKASVNLRSLTQPQQLQQAMASFVEMLSQPAFQSTSFNRVRSQMLTAIKEQNQLPVLLATRNFFASLYGNHPYAHPIIGTPASLQPLTVTDVKQFYQRYYVANNALIILVGAITTPQAQQLAEQISGALAVGKKPAAISAANLNNQRQQHINFPAKQTQIRCGTLGISATDEDFFPLLVGNYILGGSPLVSLLGTEVRVKAGLAYSIHSDFIPALAKGPFVIAMQTRNDQAARALAISQATLKAFLQQGPSEQQLQAAKQNLVGAFPLSIDSNAKISHTLATIGFYHLPLSYVDDFAKHINAVTAEQVKAAFNRHVAMNQLITVTVGPNPLPELLHE